MKYCKRLVIIILLLSTVFVCKKVFAQYEYRGGVVSSFLDEYEKKIVEDVQKDANVLLQENKQLEEQYRILKEKYDELEKEAKMYGSEIDTITRRQRKIIDYQKRKEQSQKLPQKNLENIQDNILAFEAKNTLLQGKLLDLEEAERLWTLKLVDLETKKRDLYLAINLIETSREKTKKSYDEKLENFKEKEKINLDRQKQMEDLIEKSGFEGEAALENIAKLRRENKFLERSIREKKDQKEFKDRENLLLLDKRLLETKMAENAISDFIETKEKLSKEVEDISKKYNVLQKTVDESLRGQKKQKELTQSIMEIDKENQELSEKISNIKKEINKLK